MVVGCLNQFGKERDVFIVSHRLKANSLANEKYVFLFGFVFLMEMYEVTNGNDMLLNQVSMFLWSSYV